MPKTNETIRRVLKKTMTVADLREELSYMPDDAPVMIVVDYGDISHTMQALPIVECVALDTETEYLDVTAYSNSGLAVDARRLPSPRNRPGSPDEDVVLLKV